MSKLIDCASKSTKSGFLAMICCSELLERFAYYGLVSLLIIFLTSNLGFSDTKAYATSSLFTAIGFGIPIIGGFLADKILGVRYLIVIGAITTLLGYGFISFHNHNINIVTWGLALIAVGTGIFKGNLTILLGFCYNANDQKNQDRGFTVFYTCINIGILLSAIVCGYIYKNYGIRWAFILASLGMLSSLFVFLKYQKILGRVGKIPTASLKNITSTKALFFVIFILSTVTLCTAYSLKYSVESCDGLIWLGLSMCIYCAFAVFKSSTQERPKLLVLLVIIPFLILFYGLQSQLYFVINLFAKRNLETDILGHSIPSTVIQAIAPFAAIFVGLFLGHLLKTTTQSDNSKEGFTRFGIGLLGPALCFFILYWGCIQATEGRVQYLYILSLGFIGAAEALIGPFAYNQATVLAPNHMKGYAMSIVLVAIAFGNLATIPISKFMSVKLLDTLNCEKSLVIYKSGFLKLAILQAMVCICFYCTYFFLSQYIHNSCKQK